MKLYKDFLHDDDYVMVALERSMEELRKAKLDLPGPPQKDELPTRPYGIFIEPSFEQIVGRRSETFTDKEKETNKIVTLTSDAAKETLEHESQECQLSVGESVGLAGTDIDTISGCGSIITLDSKSSVCDSLESSIYECTRL